MAIHEPTRRGRHTDSSYDPTTVAVTWALEEVRLGHDVTLKTQVRVEKLLRAAHRTGRQEGIEVGRRRRAGSREGA
jgi:hypothetical protein